MALIASIALIASMADSPDCPMALITSNCGCWWLTFGCPGNGLLQHDMVERFLLYFFTQSAHANTRGTWTTPESASIDRTHGAISFSAAGVNNVPLCIKWMHVFEEPETHTLWLAKATPRDWLAPGEAPLVIKRATTRYGRVSFSLTVSTAAETAEDTGGSPKLVVRANLTVPAGFAEAGPAGGLRLRLRAPLAHAGRLGSVTVGGKPWVVNRTAETVDFTAAQVRVYKCLQRQQKPGLLPRSLEGPADVCQPVLASAWM